MAAYYIIAAGGTGAMCARAFIYLAAAGCAEQTATYHILLMDKDKESDAVVACENLLKEYEAMRDQLGKNANCRFKFPAIQLHKWDFTDEIVDEYQKQTGKMAADLTNLTLRRLLNPNADSQTSRLLSTMYTESELDTDLNKGFYGHPNIGAPVFDYISERFVQPVVTKSDGKSVDNTFMSALHASLKTGNTHVYLYGSLFGGTGATVLPNVVLTLRGMRDPQNPADQYGKTKLILGGSVIMPYFRLPQCPPDSVEALQQVNPVDSKFAGQTQEALSYYHESGLLNEMMNLLLLGTSNLDVTSEAFARGGSQNQHFHAVLLVAAVAANRFFADQLGNMAKAVAGNPVAPQGELLLWKLNAQGNLNSALIPEELGLKAEYEKMCAFLRFSVVVAYYMDLKFRKPDQILKTDSVEVLATAKQMVVGDRHLDPKDLSNNDISICYKEPVQKAKAICRGFIQFMLDVALSGYDWSKYRKLEKGPNPVTVDGQDYYEYHLGAESSDAVDSFSDRWMDFANLDALKKILDAETASVVVDNMTLNQICSYNMLDANRAPYREGRFKHSIGQVYEDEVLHELGIYKTLFGVVKNDKRDFCEIYDLLWQKCQ